MLSWNSYELDKVSHVFRSIEDGVCLPVSTGSTRPLALGSDDAIDLVEGLFRFGNWSPWVHIGSLPVRQLYRVLGFDEHAPFRWRIEHKLVQAHVLNHFCPGSTPVTSGLSRYVAQEGLGRDRERLLADLRQKYVKRSLGFGGKPQNDAATEEAVASVLAGELVGERELVAESWIVQDRLDIEEEYRVHTFEDRVVPDLTFMRHSGHPARKEQEGPNAYVIKLLSRLPKALTSSTICGWDIAKVGPGYKVIEVNYAGFHPQEGRGFQCSGFLSQPLWGPPVFARLVRFIENDRDINISVFDGTQGPPEIRALYWWIARWLEFFKISDSITALSDCFDASRCGADSPARLPGHEPARALLSMLSGRLRATAALVDGGTTNSR